MEAKDKLEQDEAIYQAGKRAGIREVVEWIEDNAEARDMSWRFRQKWQAKLKEWGIE